MLSFACDSCKKPIDPNQDNFIEVPNLTIMFRGKTMRATNLHFEDKKCFIAWVQKNSEPSAIITATNDTRGPSA